MSKPLFQGAGISSTLIASDPQKILLFSQLTTAEILSVEDTGGALVPHGLGTHAVPLSPFASISYSQGKKIHLFYVDEKYLLQELVFQAGKWEKGPLGKYGFAALPGSGISATVKNNVPRVYYQDKKTEDIVGIYYFSRQWEVDDYLVIKDSLPGSSVSAVQSPDSEDVQLYYQDKHLHLRRYLRIDESWSQDQKFDLGIAPSRTTISAISFDEKHTQVYWGNGKHEIVFSASNAAGGWDPAHRVIGGFPLSHKLVALQPSSGKVRLYFQDTNAFLYEIRSDDGGKTWYPGDVRIG